MLAKNVKMMLMICYWYILFILIIMQISQLMFYITLFKIWLKLSLLKKYKDIIIL